LIGPRSGLVLLDKPRATSSFQAIGTVKRALGTGKVGHTGTLDRFATGLLPVLVGPATRLAPLFLDVEKSYRAVFNFGVGTETLDPEGEIVCRGEIPSLERIEQLLPGFTGRIEQVPPEYSAVHVGGQRAHMVKRQGRAPTLKARTVLIRRIIVHRYDPPELELSVECGKGTYIRALARDLARAAGSCAFVASLRRTRVGQFQVEEAVRPEDFDADRDVHQPARFLPRIPGLRCVTLEDRFRGEVLSGRPFQDSWSGISEPEDGLYAVLGRDGALLAVLTREAGTVAYRSVFPEVLS
jgi:tRNA pseudouridine55 synthase